MDKEDQGPNRDVADRRRGFDPHRRPQPRLGVARRTQGATQVRKLAGRSPLFMRLEGLASIAIGVWLALRQYSEPPRF